MLNILKRKNDTIVFFQKSLQLFRVNNRTAEILESIDRGKSNKYLLEKYTLSENEIKKAKAIVAEGNKNVPHRITESEAHPTYLKRLSINVSNTCNMKCKYCYANFGSYGSKDSLMNLDLLKLTLDKFYREFDEIGIIQVFGGEPFLNLPAFNLIGEYIDKKYAAGDIKYKTQITTVTNGTVVTKKILETIKKYQILVTVSLDGPKAVQNCNRIFLNNKGTFDIVKRNILRMKKETNQPQQIEATYSQQHVENHISIINLIKYFTSEFSDVSLHIAPVSGDDNTCFNLENREPFIQSVEDIYDYNQHHKVKANYLILDSILRSFYFPEKKSLFCDAGVELFSVSCTGYVYPCYMFIDEPGFSLINIQDPNFSRQKLLAKSKKYRDYNRQKENEVCKNCFAVNLCDGCMGVNYFRTGDMRKPANDDCDMKRKMVKNIVFKLM